MKKVVLTGFVLLFAFFANAQQFRKGEEVEINKNLSAEITWISGKIIELNSDNKNYIVRGTDNKLYNIPFGKDEKWIRKPVQTLNASMAIKTTACGSTIELVKQKVTNEFETDFSEYDSVIVTFNSVEPQKSYKNKDAEFAVLDSEVFPFNVDVTIRLVSINKEGVQRKINWQFKRKYILFQSKAGDCDITLVDKEEDLFSKI